MMLATEREVCTILAGYDPTWVPRDHVPMRSLDREMPPSTHVLERRQAASRRVNAFDITGKTFGELTAVERDLVRGRGYWRCRCSCGREVSRTSDGLRLAKHPVCDRSIPHPGVR